MERRGHLAGRSLSPPLALSISAGWRSIPGSRCSLAGARWWWRSAIRFSSGHAAPGRSGASRRSDCTWAWPVHGARLFFERDDSPDRLSLSDSRRESRGHPGAPVAPRQLPAGPGGAPRGHLPSASRLGGKRCIGACPTISRPLSAVSWRVTRFRAWPWESSSGDTSSSLAASVTATWTRTYR